MKDRGIMSTEMVRAILDGRETMPTAVFALADSECPPGPDGDAAYTCAFLDMMADVLGKDRLYEALMKAAEKAAEKALP